MSKLRLISKDIGGLIRLFTRNVNNPEDWWYSSARDYMGSSGLIELQRVFEGKPELPGRHHEAGAS